MTSSLDLTEPTHPDSQAELRARLKAKEASLESRINALQHELTHPFRALPFASSGGGSNAVVRAVKDNPVAVAVGTVALAALASFALAMRRKRKRRPAPDDRQQLVSAYLQTVLDDASKRMARGRTADEALDLAFRTRPPVIVYGDTEVSTSPAPKRSLLREGARALGSQTFLFGLNYALGRMQPPASASAPVTPVAPMPTNPEQL